MAECEAVTKRGRVCGAHALRGSQYCYMHDPARASERSSARRLGGLRRGSHAGQVSSLPAKVRTIEDILALLDYTREELSALDNGIPRARALVSLASEYRACLELSDIETRLARLEEVSSVKAR